ncbi:hypothetical protein EOE67_02575 [Rheinheimera riviphila]|uniref:Uncharacterized protein n=1 Tax=Rheinheimera riviphila TaxID=1834037 RepID=A0A437R2W7_9GAMM|nr:CsiV family protein [Rheinheimera riviphila]RVU41111.1 hypothetical protein EOE67_02575 [Rheinheimera riviphila]
MRRNVIKVHPLKPVPGCLNARAGRNFIAALLLAPTLLLHNAMAQSNSQGNSQSIETSWFEIEILAFSRDNSQRLLEQFPPKVTEVATRGSVDLLSPLYQPDLTAILLAAPACPKPEVALSTDPELSLATADVTAPLFATDEASLAAYQFQQSAFKLPHSDGYQPLPELCAIDHKFNKALNAPLNASLPGAVLIRQQPPAQLPLTPAGQEQHQPQPYLAPESALQLKDLAYQLQHRGNHQLLLHTAWRQPLSGKRAARPYRWFAGSNFGQQFDYFGRAKASAIQPATDSNGQLLQQITALEQALAKNPATPLAELQPAFNQQSNDPVWQLDGLVKVYSERMLFAETDFNLRRLSADGSTLSTYHSNDQTRLLIGEVHYLDHPHLGLVLQIRRFAPPLLPTIENAAAPGTQP